MKFDYQAFDKAGKSTGGRADAAGPAEAREQLRRQGLFVSRLSAVEDNARARPTDARAPRRSSSGKSLKGLVTFSRQLHVLISSGTPIVQALSAIERQCDISDWRAVIGHLRQRVEEGAPLSDGMRQYPRHFDAVARSLIAAGEASGTLPAMLDRLATLSRKKLHLRSSIIGAMIYPTVLIVIGFTTLVTMLMFVLPRFSILFQSLDSPLPPTTKFLLWLSSMLWSTWWFALPAFIVAAFIVQRWFARGNAREVLQDGLLRLPKVSGLTRNMLSAQLARMLGTLIESRVPLLDALQLTRDAASNARYATLLQTAEDAVGRGEPISGVLGASPLITPCVQEALRNGETSGQIGTPLIHMADFLDEENDIVLKALTTIIEPVILILLGFVVGFIALSMFLPMFDLVSAAQRQ